MGSLFSGIGGMDLGLERAGFEIAWMCEIKPYARAVLAQYWPDTPIYEDITHLHEVPPVDVLAGGFPCQDISLSRRRKEGIDGPKSGLWTHFARLIGVVRPQYVVVENVPNLLKWGMGRVLADLSTLRYDAEWEVIPAYPFGSPQLRERVILVAYPNREGLEGERISVFTHGPTRRQLWGVGISESSVLRSRNGVPAYVERIEGLGNAVVPQVAEWVGRQILRREGLLEHNSSTSSKETGAPV